MIKRTENFKVD